MWWHLVQHWLAVHTGSLNTPGAPPNYNFWSGWASDLGEVTLLGTALAFWKRSTCHTWWCPRHARYDLLDAETGLTHRLCAACHPLHSGERLNRRRIASIHERNQQRRADHG